MSEREEVPEGQRSSALAKEEKMSEERIRIRGVAHDHYRDVLKKPAPGQSRVKNDPCVLFGSEGYHELARHLLMEIHDAYAGAVTFFWLNNTPYQPEEEFDWFVAGRAFGCVRRLEHGGQGTWQDMQLAWLDDLHRAYDECGYSREVELDGGAVMPLKHVLHLMSVCRGGL
jgi:hypothetical protein